MKKSGATILSASEIFGRQLIVGLLFVTTFVFASVGGADSVAATPTGASAFRGVSPLRVLDTREIAKPKADSYNPVSIAGLARVPDSATAVVLNVTAIDAEGEGDDATFSIRGEFKGELSDIEIAPVDVAGVSE